MKKTLLIVLIIFKVALFSNLQQVSAQNKQIVDSLLNCLEKTTVDTIKVDILNELSKKYLRNNPKKAETYAIRAINHGKKSGYKKGVALSYKTISTAYYYKSNFEKTIEFSHKSLEIYKEINDKSGISKCLNNIGNGYSYMGNYGKAIEFYQKSIHVKNEIGDKKGITASINSIGRIFYYRGNYDKAIEYFKKALKISKELDDKRKISIYLNSIGAINLIKYNYDKAIEYYKKSLNIRMEIKDKRGITLCLNNIGSVYLSCSNYDKAIKYYLKSLKLTKELGDGIVVSTVLKNIGHVNYIQGNYTRAIEYYQKSLKINKENGNKRQISICLKNIGAINHKQCNYEIAIEYYRKSLKISEELEEKSEISGGLNNIGVLYMDRGNNAKAGEYFNKALRISNEIEEKNGISIALNNIGKIYENQDNLNKAIKYYQKSLQIIIEIGDKINIIHFFNSLGDTYLKQKEYNKAIEYYQKALITNFADFNDSIIYHNPKQLNALSKPLLLDTFNQKARVLYLLFNKGKIMKDIEVSISTYEQVFKLINEMRNDYNHESTKLLLSEKTKKYFTDALLAAIEFNKVKFDYEKSGKAFKNIEKSKSATLGSYLNSLRIKESMNIENTLMDKERDIAINRRFYNTEIQKLKAKKDGYDTLLVEDYQDKLFNYSRQYDTLMITLKEEYPDYYELKYQQNVAKVEDIQKQLSNKGALLNYFVGDTTLFIATITKDTLVYKVIKTDSLFDQKIIDYHIDIKTGFTKSDLKKSNYLYHYLIEPVEDLIKDKEELIIIPDENLYYVPFETLCKNNIYNENLSKIDYLIKDFSVTYHHSATLWLNSKEKKQKNTARNSNFIGFAPVFDPKVNNGYIVSNEWITDTTNTDIASRAVSSDLTNLNSLPHSEGDKFNCQTFH